MKIFSTILIITVLIFLSVAWTNNLFKLTPLKFVVPKNWPQPVYDFKNNPLTKEGFELGRALFYDEILSKDSTISCASCHQQFVAFTTYAHNLSHGINNSFTTRNAPALQNLAWQNNFMWDGSINHLDMQPITPITAQNEMGETLQNIIIKLNRNKHYKQMFKAAFGNEIINTQRITKAISQFVIMLVSNNSKYDKVMRRETTFILPEQLGYEIFKQKCAACHKEPFFTDFSFRNNGITADSSLNDFGRMKVTNNKNDSLKFRVPSLRNVAVTAPYGHDGRFFSLMNVFEHYQKNMKVMQNTDSLLQHKIPLTNFEIGQLTAFLYTLTDSSFLNNTMFAPPSYNIAPNFTHNH
ncbi:MAG: cytochrome-c peroxidase [Bacteroidetes bacterium]|nr:cytochrome-c peroxidase [Bacteroidota bacterium]